MKTSITTISELICSPVFENSTLLANLLHSAEVTFLEVLFSIWLQSLPYSGFPLLPFSPSFECALAFLPFQYLVEVPQTQSRIPLYSLSVGNLTCKCKISYPSLCWWLLDVMICQMHFYSGWGACMNNREMSLFPGLSPWTPGCFNTTSKLQLLWRSVVQILHQRNRLL